MTHRLTAFPVKHPSAVLLFVQILGILLYPLMEDTSAERALFGVFGLLVLGAALYVVKRGPWLTLVAVVIAVPVVVLSIWLAFDFGPRRMVLLAVLEAAFYFYAAGSRMRKVVPPGSERWIESSPPCASTALFAMERPRPVPPAASSSSPR